jgi:hypothetical protein
MRNLIHIIDNHLNEDNEQKPKVFSKNDLLDMLKQAGYENNSVKGNKIKVLVQVPKKSQTDYRVSVLKDILNFLKQNASEQDPEYSNDSGLSSIGGIIFGANNFSIVVKDEGKQGEKSSGVANEVTLAGIISSVIEKYGKADITFTDNTGKTLTIDNAIEVELVGHQIKGRRKTDILIKSADKKLPLSIKQLDADHWESADRLIGDRARKMIDKLVKEGYVSLDKIGTRLGEPIYKLSKEIVMEPTPEEAMAAVFGEDINPEGGIVIQTFKPEHFKQDENKIEIDAYAIIKTPEDIPKSHVLVWILRNNKDRNSKTLGIPGIRPLGVTLQRGLGKTGTKDVIYVDIEGNLIKPSDFSKDDKKDEEEKIEEPEDFAKAADAIAGRTARKKAAAVPTVDVGRQKRKK